jgi:hypothetical protein
MRGTKGGYATFHGEFGPVREADTYTCQHCQRVTILKPREFPHGTCKACMGFICARCYGALTLGEMCRPTARRLADYERKIRDALERKRAVGGYR